MQDHKGKLWCLVYHEVEETDIRLHKSYLVNDKNYKITLRSRSRAVKSGKLNENQQ